MSPVVRSFGIVALVVGRYAYMAGCGVRITLDDGPNGCMHSARIQFEDVESYAPLEIDLQIEDEEAFRGLVELAIFKHRNPGVAL